MKKKLTKQCINVYFIKYRLIKCINTLYKINVFMWSGESLDNFFIHNCLYKYKGVK